MAQTVLEMAKDLVMAQIKAGSLPPEALQEGLHTAHLSLLALKAREDAGQGGLPEPANGKARTPRSWRKSIGKSSVTCLECGATFKQLSIRHLKDHALDPRSYRVKHGIPRTQPLSAKDTTAIRKEIVQRSRPWEKAPTYLKAHGGEKGTKAAAKQVKAAAQQVKTAGKRTKTAAKQAKTAR